MCFVGCLTAHGLKEGSSRTEGGEVLVCSAVLLPKEAKVWEMGKMVEKWDTPSRLTLFTSALTPHWSPHLACVWQPALRPWHQPWDPPSARCSPCSSTGHSACWHRIWVVYKKRTGDSIQNSIPGHSFTDWDWNHAFWDWSVILIPYVYFYFLTWMLSHLINNQAKVLWERRTWQWSNEQNNALTSKLSSVLPFSLTWTALWMGNVIKDRYKLLCNTYLLPLWTSNRCRRWSRESVSLWSIASVLQQWCLCLDKYWQKYQPCHHLEKEEEIFLKPG